MGSVRLDGDPLESLAGIDEIINRAGCRLRAFVCVSS